MACFSKHLPFSFLLIIVSLLILITEYNGTVLAGNYNFINLVLIIFLSLGQWEECGKNAHWVTNPASANGCGNNCQNYHIKTRICTKKWVPGGCDCKPFFVFKGSSQSGDCIPLHECPLHPAACGLNAHWEPACSKAGAGCQLTCSNYRNVGSDYYRTQCSANVCQPGCDCDPGFLFNDAPGRGKCVPASECQ